MTDQELKRARAIPEDQPTKQAPSTRDATQQSTFQLDDYLEAA